MKWILLLFLISLFSSCSKDTKEIYIDNTQTKVERVILLIGDGMGPIHINALKLERGNDNFIFFHANSVATVKTRSANSDVTDSAAAATAIACGKKTNNGYLGVDPDGNELKSIMRYATENGWKTGLIVTSEMTNATPAAFYSNTESRYNDNKIVNQLIDSEIDILIGGGISNIKQGMMTETLRHRLEENNYSLISDIADFDSQNHERIAFFTQEYGMMPTILNGRSRAFIPHITEKVLNRWDTDNFFLMIEGSQIDTESHNNNLSGVVAEISDFENTARKCFEFASRNPGTLVVVTSDHETGGLTYSEQFLINYRLTESSFKFLTTSHTSSPVPLYAFGAGADNFGGIMDNTDIFRIIMRLVEWKE